MSYIKIPEISGEWHLLFKPEKYGNYVNDHSIICDSKGVWHLFGITSHTGIPSDERYFVHALTEKKLYQGNMKEYNKVIDNGTLAWAPSVINADDKYYMFYGPSPTKLAISYELNEWIGQEINMFGNPPLSCHRDHFVMKLNDYTWIMYAVGLKDGYGCISCFVSNDLINWRFVQYALTSGANAPLKPAWGAFESPYVVKKDNIYYLFLTYTDCDISNYQDTLVFASYNPYDFGHYTGDNYNDLVIAKLPVHAGEVIKCDNDYYITTCGWNNKNIPIEGAVSISKLNWK